MRQPCVSKQLPGRDAISLALLFLVKTAPELSKPKCILGQYRGEAGWFSVLQNTFLATKRDVQNEGDCTTVSSDLGYYPAVPSEESICFPDFNQKRLFCQYECEEVLIVLAEVSVFSTKEWLDSMTL